MGGAWGGDRIEAFEPIVEQSSHTPERGAGPHVGIAKRWKHKRGTSFMIITRCWRSGGKMYEWKKEGGKKTGFGGGRRRDCGGKEQKANLLESRGFLIRLPERREMRGMRSELLGGLENPRFTISAYLCLWSEMVVEMSSVTLGQV